MPDVFVSYRHTDEVDVSPIADGLSQRGLDVWFDRTDIRAGDRWRDEIAEGIRTARAVVVSIGPTGIGGVQAFEVDRALDRAVHDPDFPIIPLLLGEALTEGTRWDELSRYSFLALDGALTDDLVDRIADAVRGLDGQHEHDAHARPTRSPYPGLRPLDADEADLFFGRDADIAAVLGLCAEPGLCAVVGPSGLGKSSLVRAGVLPQLTRAGPGERTWHAAVTTPGYDPMTSVLVALAVVGPGQPDVAAAGDDASALTTAMLLALQRLPAHDGIVLLVDQLEELVTVCDDLAQRRRFTEALAHLGARCPERARVIVTLRSDFLSDLLEHPALSRLVAARTHLLAPIDHAGLVDVIQRPAWACGLRLEPRLVDQIVLDVADQPNALPLLSVALREMWTKRQGDRLTLRAYSEGGRVEGAIDGLAERAAARFLELHEPVLRSTMLRLVHLSPSSPPARRRQSIGQLDVDVVHTFANAGLVVTDEDRVELAHDAVITSWRRLAQWVAAARGGDGEVRQRVEDAAAQWRATDCSPRHLATAGLLSEAIPLDAAGRLLLTPAEREFLAASQRAAARDRRRRWSAVAAAVVAAVALVGAGVLVRQNSLQRRENRDAFAARLAAQSAREVSDRPDLALRLASSAYAEADLASTRSALATTLTQPVQLIDVWAPPIDGQATAASIVPGSDTFVLGTAQGGVWTCSTVDNDCTPERAEPLNGAIISLVATADGALAAVLDTGEVVAAPSGLDLTVISPATASGSSGARGVAVDNVGGQLAIAMDDGSIVTTNLLGGTVREIGRIDGAPGAIAIASPSGQVAAASLSRHGFVLFDRDGATLADLSTDDGLGGVAALAFDQSGEHLIAEDDSNDVLVYSVEDLRTRGGAAVPVRLVGHEEPIDSFHVDGDRLTSIDTGGVVWRWDLLRNRPDGPPVQAQSSIGEPTRHLLAAGRSPDGARLVGVASGVIVEWDALGHPAMPHQALAFGGSVAAVAVDSATDETVAATSDGALVSITADGATASVTTSAVGNVQAIAAVDGGAVAVGGDGLAVADATTGVVRAARDDLDVTALATSPSGDRIAVATRIGELHLLSVDDLSELSEPPGPLDLADGPLTDVAWSPDGSVVAAGRQGEAVRTVVVVDLGSGQQRELVGHSAEVSSMAFHPSGDLLASGSDDRTVILWDTTSWQQVGVLTGHTDRVRRLTFDATGEMLVTAGDDHTLRWWDVDTRTPVGLPIRWDARGVRDVVAGRTTVTSLHEGVAVSWSTDPAQWAARACEITDRDLTNVEHAAYAGDRPLADACDST